MKTAPSAQPSRNRGIAMHAIDPAARNAAWRKPPLCDAFGREITYLRLSLTDRSNLRSLSCLRNEIRRLPKAEVLSLEETERLCDAFVRLGIRKIRLVGGEPLLRSGAMGLIARLGARLAFGGLEELTLTTNGTLLAAHAVALAAAGMRRVNVALDTLDESTFRLVTERDGLADVLAGIDAARAAGLAVRINFMALAGINDNEFDRLIHWCGEHDCDLALIEAMPYSDLGADYYLPLDMVRWHLSSRWTLLPAGNPSGGPGRCWTVAETGCRLSFISPISVPFCATCNRVQVSCAGRLASCVTRRGSVDLRAALRGSEADDALEAAIAAAIAAKPRCHAFVAGHAGQMLAAGPAHRCE